MSVGDYPTYQLVGALPGPNMTGNIVEVDSAWSALGTPRMYEGNILQLTDRSDLFYRNSRQL